MLCAACERFTVGQWADDQIDQDIVYAVDQVNFEVLEAVVKQNHYRLRDVASDRFLELTALDSVEAILASLPGAVLQAKPRIAKRQLSRTLLPGQQVVAEFGGYAFAYVSVETASIVYFNEVTFPEGSSMLVYNVFVEREGAWELEFLGIDAFRKNGWTYNRLARRGFAALRGDRLIEAALYNAAAHDMDLERSAALRHPSSGATDSFFHVIQARVGRRYEFPDTLRHLPGAPVLLGARLLSFTNGLLPVFEYVANVPAADVPAHERQLEALVDHLATEYGDLNRLGDTIVLRGFEHYPTERDPSLYRTELYVPPEE